MPNVTPLQYGFSAGELSPELLTRSDTAGYQFGAQVMRNFISDPRGPARSRDGFRFIGAVTGGEAPEFEDNLPRFTGKDIIFADFHVNNTSTTQRHTFSVNMQELGYKIYCQFFDGTWTALTNWNFINSCNAGIDFSIDMVETYGNQTTVYNSFGQCDTTAIETFEPFNQEPGPYSPLLGVPLYPIGLYPVPPLDDPNTLVVGPGETYETLPDALAAAVDGNNIVLKAGTHVSPSLVIATNVRIYGEFEDAISTVLVINDSVLFGVQWSLSPMTVTPGAPVPGMLHMQLNRLDSTQPVTMIEVI